MKRLAPGERFNRYQAKKQPRVKQVDQVAVKERKQLAKISKEISQRKKVAIIGLI